MTNIGISTPAPWFVYASLYAGNFLNLFFTYKSSGCIFGSNDAATNTTKPRNPRGFFLPGIWWTTAGMQEVDKAGAICRGGGISNQ